MKLPRFILAITVATAVVAIAQQRPAAELVQNGDFESDMAGWSYVARGDAKGSIQIVTDNPSSPRGPHSLRIEATKLGEACGAANAGGAGMNIQTGQWYDVTFSARKESDGGLGFVFALETAGGKACARTTLPEVGRGGIGRAIEGNDVWRQYTVSLHAYASDAKCRLLICPIEPGTLFIDDVSLVPRKQEP